MRQKLKLEMHLNCTHMLQIPKADARTPGQDPEEMGGINCSVGIQINLVQASQTPGNTIEVHPWKGF